MASRRKQEQSGDDARAAAGGGGMPGGSPADGALTGANGGGRANGMPGGSMTGSPSGPVRTGDQPTQDEPGRRCATMDVHRRMLTESPAYRLARAEIENATQEYVADGREDRFPGVVHIPVVVHVVWKTATQNISDAQVKSQIDVLNHDFRATKADVGTVPPVFRHLVADTRVEFFLATTDPNGDPTDGIVRRATNVTSFSSNDAIKSGATGGSDAWPADRYLNIWVGQLGGGLLGYAQFPGGPAETDGVVVLHTAFGNTGTATPPFHLGRTTTHEIGHYLNLFHIWGDDGVGCGGTDEVADTPNQGGPNVGVPTFPHVSCNNGPNGDLFMNYMDYVDDAVMVMFTEGQRARMEACLDGIRHPLIAGRRTPEPAGPVVSWGADRLDAFVLGTDRALHHKWWDGNAWGPSVAGYEHMGGVCMKGPEVASWGPDRLDVFVLGTDRALYHKWWDGNAWGPSLTGYEHMGGICTEQPEVVAWGPNRLDVFVIGTDSALYHKWWDGNAWGPSLTGYEYMGGVLICLRAAVPGAVVLPAMSPYTPPSALSYKLCGGHPWGA